MHTGLTEAGRRTSLRLQNQANHLTNSSRHISTPHGALHALGLSQTFVIRPYCGQNSCTVSELCSALPMGCGSGTSLGLCSSQINKYTTVIFFFLLPGSPALPDNPRPFNNVYASNFITHQFVKMRQLWRSGSLRGWGGGE